MSNRQLDLGSSSTVRPYRKTTSILSAGCKSSRVSSCTTTNNNSRRWIQWATLAMTLPHVVGFSTPLTPTSMTRIPPSQGFSSWDPLTVNAARNPGDIRSLHGWSSSTTRDTALWAVKKARGASWTSQLFKSSAAASDTELEEDVDDDDDSYEYIEDVGAYATPGQSDSEGYTPRPPPIPPLLDEVLEKDLMEAERRIQLYEMEMDMMRDQLILKSNELQEEQNTFREERSSLMFKLTEFANLLAQRDDELTAQSQAEIEFKAKEETLKKEVQDLKDQLKVKMQEYDKEVAITVEVKKRYADANDAMEFQQTAFQKEKENLQKALDGEKKNIKTLENKLKDVQTAFDNTREELTKRLRDEQEKLLKTEGSWFETKQSLLKAQQDIQETLREKEKALTDSKRELNSQRELDGVEMEELKKRILAEQLVVRDVRQELQTERAQFEKSQKELIEAIDKEQKVVLALQEEMLRESTRFQTERSKLENRIATEFARVSMVETELAGERDKFSKMKEKLEYRLSEEIRVQQLKKRQMNDRYTEIRKEMTALWQNSIRDARREQERLTKKYTRKLEDVRKQVARLAGEVGESEESSKDLDYLLAKAEEKKNQIIAESQAMEERYKESLKQRDVVISDLQDNVSSLRKDILLKEGIIEQQRRELGRYETSFRAVARLSLVVTGNKIKGVGRGVRKASGWLIPPSEDE